MAESAKCPETLESGCKETRCAAHLGEAGEQVGVHKLDAEGLEGLDKRVGEPLRELMERDHAGGVARRPQHGVLPAVAESLPRLAQERQKGPSRGY
jgi:hypothetical protein